MRDHALGKARSVAGEAGDRPVLGVDTTVVLDGRIYAKPDDAGDAERMLEELAGRTHAVVSGLCLITPGWELVERRRDARHVPPADAARPRVRTSRRGEWEGRAGGYAIQGLGAALVERVEGDYLNVVGLPAALLCACWPSASPASTASASKSGPIGKPLARHIGVPRFELGTSPTRTERATRLRHTPSERLRVAEPQRRRCTTSVQASST